MPEEFERRLRVRLECDELVPRLRSELTKRASDLVRFDGAGTDALVGAISSAQSLAELREVARAVDRLALARPLADAAGVPVGEVPTSGFEVCELQLRFAVVSEQAAALDEPFESLASAAASVAAITPLATAGAGDAAMAELLAGAREALQIAEEELVRSQAAAECRHRTRSALAAALADIGYRVVDTGSASLTAVSAADRRSEIVFSQDDGGMDVLATVHDDGDAVAPGHPDSSALCEGAAADQLALQRAFAEAARQAGLIVGRPGAVGAATRGRPLQARKAATAPVNRAGRRP
jgi:hypothetical protein